MAVVAKIKQTAYVAWGIVAFLFVANVAWSVVRQAWDVLLLWLLLFLAIAGFFSLVGRENR